MVALLGLLDACQIRLEVLVGEPRGAVDALQHRASRVAAPVRARDLRELERPDPARVGHVRSAAQVGEVALRVDRDGLALGQVLDELALVRLALESVPRLEPVQLPALERLRLGHDLAHAALDGGDVLGRERPLDVEVVVEAVLDGGSDGELRHREEVLDRLGHHVGGGVPQHAESVIALLGDDLDRRSVGHDVVEIDQLAVDLAGDRGLRQARPDRGRDVEDGRTFGNGLRAAVRQGHLDVGHCSLLGLLDGR